MTVKENHALKEHNTFGINAYAKYFIDVTTESELLQAIEFYKKLEQYPKTPLLFLGGGSNILFRADFPGLVIKLSLKGIKETTSQETDRVMVSAMAGENWHEFVLYTLSKNYGGLENLSLIPGNVGTSPMQNIGAYGREIKDLFIELRALNLETLEIETLSHSDCNFGYRESIFKNTAKGKYAILEVSFSLSTANHILNTSYGAIEKQLEKNGVSEPTIHDVSKAVVEIRESKLPNPSILGNAGSFFKNPTISVEAFEKLLEKDPEIPSYPQPTGVKVPAGYLIEKQGWKGKQIGNVACHELQSLVIVNKTGNASGEEIFDFSQQIIDSVKSAYGITLEREVNIV